MNRFSLSLKVPVKPPVISIDCHEYQGVIPIQRPLFLLNGEIFYLSAIPPRSTVIDKTTSLLSGDELTFTGTYTWVIMTIGDNLMIFYKETINVLEIQTKHYDIIHDICELYPDNYKVLHYAGELRYKDDMGIMFNFLSGTFMTGLIDATRPDEEHVQFVRNCIFDKTDCPSKGVLSENIRCDITGDSYITDIPITIEIIRNYKRAGAVIYYKPYAHEIISVMAWAIEQVKIKEPHNLNNYLLSRGYSIYESPEYPAIEGKHDAYASGGRIRIFLQKTKKINKYFVKKQKRTKKNKKRTNKNKRRKKQYYYNNLVV